jgi:RNA polymerase sigma-70 factor (ECF subfamily)
MSRMQEFDTWRPLLLATAHRILGDADRAAEAVRRTWRYYEALHTEPASVRDFLTETVARISAGLPHPAEQRPVEDVLTRLEGLSPPERAVYLLRELFGCGVEETASAIGCSPAVCRRLIAASGTTPPWPRRVAGAEQVARMLAATVRALTPVGVTVEPCPPGHGPGAVFHDRTGRTLGTAVLDILDGRIRTIRWLTGLNKERTWTEAMDGPDAARPWTNAEKEDP